MTRAGTNQQFNARPAVRRKVILCLLLSVAASALWGFWIERHTRGDKYGDFRAVYFSAQVALRHHDPYSQSDFLSVYRQEGGALPHDPTHIRNFRRGISECVNLPSTLLLVAPFALFGWTASHLLWMILLPAGLFLAGLSVWDLAGARAPGLTLFLICTVLANCEILLQLGNVSGMAVSLCIAAIWCFFKKRHELAGVVCLAASLALKPQEGFFLWLFFLLAGGTFRRKALQTAGIALIFAALSVVWISSVSPHWLGEWHSNVAATTGHGDLNDPGPSSFASNDLDVIVSLQSVISWFRNDPDFYNPASYLVAGSLILFWAIAALSSSMTERGAWLAIASISALSLLPVYHREYDPKLLLLTLPAMAILWDDGGTMRRFAVGFTAVGIFLTADLPLALLAGIERTLHLPQDQFAGKVASVLLLRASTFALLLVGTFYLWLMVRDTWSARTRAGEGACEGIEFANASAPLAGGTNGCQL